MGVATIVRVLVTLSILGQVSAAPFHAVDAPFHVVDALPTDCRNQTAKGMPGQDDGKLVVMSWHIHYNTVSSDQERFYDGFIEKFKQFFPPSTYAGFEMNQCPFGPNFGSNSPLSLHNLHLRLLAAGRF